jgi:hypothetical protein
MEGGYFFSLLRKEGDADDYIPGAVPVLPVNRQRCDAGLPDSDKEIRPPSLSN